MADKGKKSKVAEMAEEADSDPIDGDLLISVEKLQEVQDELEKVLVSTPFFFFCKVLFLLCTRIYGCLHAFVIYLQDGRYC